MLNISIRSACSWFNDFVILGEEKLLLVSQESTGWSKNQVDMKTDKQEEIRFNLIAPRNPHKHETVTFLKKVRQNEVCVILN